MPGAVVTPIHPRHLAIRQATHFVEYLADRESFLRLHRVSTSRYHANIDAWASQKQHLFQAGCATPRRFEHHGGLAHLVGFAQVEVDFVLISTTTASILIDQHVLLPPSSRFVLGARLPQRIEAVFKRRHHEAAFSNCPLFVAAPEAAVAWAQTRRPLLPSFGPQIFVHQRSISEAVGYMFAFSGARGRR